MDHETTRRLLDEAQRRTDAARLMVEATRATIARSRKTLVGLPTPERAQN